MSSTDQARESGRPNRRQALGNWVVFLAAVGVLGIGIWLLVDILRGAPVAADFTRVGGATDVETAVDASRFWLSAPASVVETPSDASQQVMLGAAACAIARDAPLLLASTGPSRKRLVEATANGWPKSSTSRSPTPIAIETPGEAARCLPGKGHLVKIKGLSILQVPSQKQLLPWIPTQQTLSPFVVFAAAITPTHLPDVAVGLALAAHLAEADGEQVSLVFVEPYVEADPKLEDQLRSQPSVVKGGIVLGQTPTVPDDTRELLRQLITSVNRQNLLDQLQANLGSVAPLVAAVLALFGGVAASRRAPAIMHQVIGFGHWVRYDSADVIKGTSQKAMERIRSAGDRVPSLTGENVSRFHLLAQLKPEETVTVWLSSGWKATGKVVDKTKEALHLSNATLKSPGESPGRFAHAFIPVEDIQLVSTGAAEKEPDQEEGSAA